VVCNSDGHKGRPGASYPGAAKFGAYGGLTCFLTDELTRDGIFECLRRRHHYGTTGCRMHLEVNAAFPGGADLFDRDPGAFDDATATRVDSAMMGDIVRSDAGEVELSVHVVAHAPIERIEVRNGTDVIRVLRPYAESDLGSRVRVVWSGAEYRGRGRQSTWIGRARFGGCVITRREKLNAWNHERLLECNGSNTVEWNAITTGNFGGFDAWLDEGDDASLDLVSNHGEIRARLADIGYEDTVLEAGGLERRIRVFRLPEENTHREMRETVSIPMRAHGDDPLWVCVTTEDGFQAWSSPIFVFR